MRRSAVLLLSGWAGCATPAFQASPGTAASLASAEAPPALVTMALFSEPPLPGEDEGAWQGLQDQAAPPAVAHAGDEDIDRMLSAPLTVDAAVRIALISNRFLRASLRDTDVARALAAQAGLPPNPVIEAEKPIEPEVVSEWGVEYDLTHALLAPLRKHAAEADVDAARLVAARTAMEIGLDVRYAFFEAQAVEEKLAVAQRTLDALAAGRDAAKALLEAGNVPALTVASQVAAFERARALVAQLELQVAASREQLHRVLGLHGSQTRWRLAGKLAAPPADLRISPQLETRAIEHNLELAELRSRLTGVRRRLILSRTRGWLPDVSVAARMGELQHGDRAHRERRWAGGLALTIPLFDRNQGAVRALGAAFDGLSDRYEGLAVEIRSAAREARNRLVSAHGRALQFQNVILPAQRHVTEQTLLQFNAMQVGVFQLLLARRDELDTELAAIETLREFWTAAAGFDAAMSGLRPRAAIASGLPSLNNPDPQGAH